MNDLSLDGDNLGFNSDQQIHNETMIGDENINKRVKFMKLQECDVPMTGVNDTTVGNYVIRRSKDR